MMTPEDLKRRAVVFGRIMAERDRQDATWGEQNHSDLRWMAIFVEEGLESVARAVNNTLGDGDLLGLEDELVQALAVGVAWLECRMRHRLGDEYATVDDMVREAIASLPARGPDGQG